MHSVSTKTTHSCAVAIFARAPSPGRAKTRLIPLLGARGAAEFQAALISDSIRKVNALGERASRYVFFAGTGSPAPAALFSRFTLVRQRGADLGERLAHAFRKLLRRHAVAVVIGTDSPTLAPRVLRAARRELHVCDAVLGPSPDGGFYLIGLRRTERAKAGGLFRGIRWGSAFAFRDTLRNLLRHGLACSILEPCADVDRPEDFRRLVRELAGSQALRRGAPAVWRFVKELGAVPEDSAAARNRLAR
ncbi:MAG: TIGR04282 family arsenosugar biosynthesis glycosyltransferase [Terriglobia bacterium]